MKMTRISLGFALMTMVIANAAFAQNVKTDYAKGTNFASYKTFMWIKEPKTTNPLTRQRVIDDVNSALAARGLQLVTSDADLCVAAHAATTGGAHAQYLLQRVRRRLALGRRLWQRHDDGRHL